MKYKVWFEIYGKKMLSIVEANDPEDAKAAVKSKIQIHKIEKIEEPRDNVAEYLMNMFNMK